MQIPFFLGMLSCPWRNNIQPLALTRFCFFTVRQGYAKCFFYLTPTFTTKYKNILIATSEAGYTDKFITLKSDNIH